MLCGSQYVERHLQRLGRIGLTVSPKTGVRGDYLIERAFVDQ